MPPSSDFTEHVFRHGAALRQLARELVGTASADDVVQETWLGALHRPPRHDASIGGWLAVLLRNVVLGTRRRDRRRLRREQAFASARGDAAEDVGATIARAEVARQLITAVEALEPVYRDAIWQRYFEGLAPRAIAASAGVPVATVKSRLQRGLAMLRERLGAAKDAADWRSAFAIAFGLGRKSTALAASGAAVGISGGLLMATWTKVAIVVAGALAAVLCWPRDAGMAPVAAGGVVAPPVVTAEVGKLEKAADPGAAAPASNDERTPVPATGRDAALATIRGRCVDEQGTPLAGCSARLHGEKASDERMELWLRDHRQPEWTDPAVVTTDADGAFAIRFAPPPPFQFWLRLHSEHHGAMQAQWQELGAGAVVDLGDVTMQRGGRLTGRVVDGEGRPVPDNFVVVDRVDQRQRTLAMAGQLRPHAASVRSDASGAFVLGEPLVPGSYTVESKGAPQREPLVVEVRAAETSSIVVVVDRPEQVTIRGRVLDDTGMPVVDARVMGRPRPRGSFWTTDRDGAFELKVARSDAGGPIDVIAESDVHEGAAVAKAVAWGREDVVLTLTNAARLELHVVDSQQRPVPDFAVRVMSREHPSSADARVRARGPFADGIATIVGVRKGQWLVLVEFPAASGLANSCTQLVVASAGTTRLVVTAMPRRERRVQVVDEAGQPVAGADVVACDPVDGVLDEATLLVVPETLVRVSGPKKALVVDRVTTDAAGFAILHGPAQVPMALALPGNVHRPLFLRDVRLDEPTPLVITVARGARLRAQVQPPAALAALRQFCGATDGVGFGAARRPTLVLSGAGRTIPNPAEWMAGNAVPGAITDAGTFDVRGLPRERFDMMLWFWPVTGGVEQVPAGTVDFTQAAEQDVALDLTALLPGTLRGSLTVNGRPAVLRAVRLEGPCTREIETDGDGRFTATVPAGVYRVLAPLSAGARHVFVPLADVVTVARETVTDLPLAVQSGRLRLRLVDAHGQPVAHTSLVAKLTGSDAIVRLPGTDDGGALEVELPVGTVTFAVPVESFAGTAAGSTGGTDLGTASIRGNEATSCELRLPAAGNR